MVLYRAENVELTVDTDYGEGWVTFQWPDQLYGWECLMIYVDGHCSRRMPIRSGNGLPEFVALQRDRIKLRFDPVLAAKLELEQEVEIAFDVSDDVFRELQKAITYINGETG
jgi:hypothetical protein